MTDIKIFDNRRIKGQITKRIKNEDIKELKTFIQTVIKINEHDKGKLKKTGKILLNALEKNQLTIPHLAQPVMSYMYEVEKIINEKTKTTGNTDEVKKLKKDLKKKDKEIQKRMEYAQTKFEELQETVEYTLELDCGWISKNLVISSKSTSNDPVKQAEFTKARDRIIAWNRSMTIAIEKSNFDKDKFYPGCILEFSGCCHPNHDTHNIYHPTLDKIQDLTGINDAKFQVRINPDNFTRSTNYRDYKTIIKVIGNGKKK